MLVNMNDILKLANKEYYAIPQLNINNLEWIKYILESANEISKPVILGASEGAIKYMGGYHVVSNLVKTLILDLNITIPVSLHLDHGSSVDSCKKAIDAGFTSVMIDASGKSLLDNINQTKEVVMYAQEKNVSVEGEIGSIGGSEENGENSIKYANIDDCVRYVKESGVHVLAPAVGSVHGLSKGEPKIDFELIDKIKQVLPIPLVLHGGTGLSNETLIKTIKYGINKINFNTELQVEWSKAVRYKLNSDKDVYDPRKIIGSGEEAIKKVVLDKIKLLQEK